MSRMKRMVRTGLCLAMGMASFIYQHADAASAVTSHPIAAAERGASLFDPPAVPTLLTPLNGAHSVPNTVALRFAPVDGADRYNVQVATDAAFNAIVFQINVPKSPVSFTAPFPNAKYFWRVQSVGEDGMSKFSVPWSFSLFAEDDCGVDPPALLTPLNGAFGVPDMVNLRFAPAAGAERYNVQVATDAAFNDIVFTANVPSSPVAFTAPVTNVTYFWHVQSVGGGATCKYGPTWQFSTSPQPASDEAGIQAPELWAPLNGTTDVPDPVQLIFSPMSSAVRYNLQVATDATFAQIVYRINVPKPPVWFNTPFDNTTYYWRVQTVGATESSKFSSPWSFTRGGGAPGELDGFRTEPVDADSARTFVALKNFPDPFNPSTTILIDVLEPSHIKLSVYDLLGREVSEVASGDFEIGRHVFFFDASNLAGGTYFYRVESAAFTQTRMMTVMK